MWFRKTLAVLLTIIFVPICIITILGWNVKLTLLNPNFLIQELSKNKVYESAIGFGADLIVQSMIHGQADQQGSQSISTTLTTSLKSAIKPEFVQEQLEAVIQAAFAYFYGQTPSIQATVNLKPAKEALNNAFSEGLKQSFMGLPECKSLQESQSQQNSCRPPGIKWEDLQKGLGEQSETSSFTQSLPDGYDLGALARQFGPVLIVRQYLNYFLIGLYLLTAVSFLLMILVGLLIFKPLSSVLKWLATTLLIPGLLLLGTIFLNLLVSMFVKGSTWSLPPEMSTALNNLVSGVSYDIIKQFLYFAGGLVIVAIAFYILAALLKPKQSTVSESKAAEKPQNKPAK